jgi:ribonuclease HI
VTPPRSRTPSLFAPNTSTQPAPDPAWITAHCDGGARGNPGPAGYGAEITDSTGTVLAELSEFLGIRTNNFAEYSGLLASLQYALDHHQPRLRVVSDSELMVKQIQGKYKVNSPDLKPLWQEAKNRIAKLERFEITHALRHKNKAADRLANEAMDRGMRRNAPAEARPVIRSGADTTRVDSLPLRAIPYPARSEAPPVPIRLDPASPPPPLSSQPQAKRSADEVEGPTFSPPQPQTLPSRPEPGRSDVAAERPTSQPPAPTMLRGFTRDGVIHILGGHTLPEGRFVKIIPE